jgi:eukaryotic-like serine/threonine-protein kinase
MQGDAAKAKAAYQNFLTLRKDADPDIPVFIAAKSEYAKLHNLVAPTDPPPQSST